jgi:dipeptidyl aminopeptidase/acylaminoacyl peptidase
MTRIPRCRAALVAVTILAVALSGADAQVTRPHVPAEISPVTDITVLAHDGHEVIAVVRLPPGDGPFPAVIALHGGLATMTRDVLRDRALSNPTMTRLLANGYVTVVATRRDAGPETQELVSDTLAVVDYVKRMDSVDPDSVAIYGCSAGGDLALDISIQGDVAAVASEEPGVVLFTGMLGNEPPLNGETYTPPEAVALYQNPQAHYTPELQTSTRAKVGKIDEPIFLIQGDQLFVAGTGTTVDLVGLENEILVREMDAAGKQWTRSVYAGQTHCFGFAGITEASRDFFEDMDRFFRQHLPTPPTPLDRSLVNYVEVEPAR